MSSNDGAVKDTEQQSPVAILRAQHDVLSMVYKETAAQNDILRKSLSNLKDINDYPLNVYIEDINMPFMALVGLMVKIALASIPAIILITVIYVILGFILLALGVSYLSLPTFQ